MNEETTPASAEAPEATSQTPEGFSYSGVPQDPAPPSPPPPASTGSSGPNWPLLAIAAVVPAIIVGIIVFVLAGGGSSSSSSDDTGLVEGFVKLTVGGGSDLESFDGEAPPDFPTDFPTYKGTPVETSFLVAAEDQTTYIVAYSLDDSIREVYEYYLEALDTDPWQIDLARDSDDYTGMQFTRPDSADIEGSLTVTRSDLDGKTAVFVIINDLSRGAINDSSDYVVPEARDLPPGFPDDVPVYQGENPTTVTDTYFQRDAGTNSFLLTFVTKDKDTDIIDYYKQEFGDRGWNVEDGEAVAGDFALTIQFDDGDTQDLSGTIRADVLADDPDYYEVTLIVQVSATRGRGN